MHKNIFTVPVNFARSYTEDERNFPRRNNLILQKMASSVDKAVISRPFQELTKKSSTFQRTLTEFKDFLRRLLKFKTFFKIV